MSRSSYLSFISLLIAVLIFVGGASAQDSTPDVPTDDEVNAIAAQLYCPVCENTPLDVCPTQACAEWRELIREKLAEGWSEEQINQYFSDRFGDRVLATPPPRGLNWLVYIIPPFAFVVGAYLLYRAFVGWRLTTKQTFPVHPEQSIVPENGPRSPLTDDEYVARLEEELRKL